MNVTSHAQVVGIFEDHEQARQAIAALLQAGFSDDEIGVASAHRDEFHTAETGAEHIGDNYAAAGAMTGVAAGAGVGALWGLAALAGVLPVIGPAIAAGTLAALISSAAAGAAAAGLGGALIGMGISKDEAAFYEAQVVAGNTIVTVTSRQRVDEARKIVQRFGGYDMASRASQAMAQRDQGPPHIAPSTSAQPSHGHRAPLGVTLRRMAEHAGDTSLSTHTSEAFMPEIPEHTKVDTPVMPEDEVADTQNEIVDEELDMPPVIPPDAPEQQPPAHRL